MDWRRIRKCALIVPVRYFHMKLSVPASRSQIFECVTQIKKKALRDFKFVGLLPEFGYAILYCFISSKISMESNLV